MWRKFFKAYKRYIKQPIFIVKKFSPKLSKQNINNDLENDLEHEFLINLIRYILINKYSARILSSSEELFYYLDCNKNKVNQLKLLNNIKKNKLINFIESDKTIYQFFPQYIKKLKKIKSIYKIISLNYFIYIGEIIKILKKENIPFILLKGVALSKLIYGDLYSRYSIDIDIFIDKKNLLKTTNVFLKNKYRIRNFNTNILTNKKILKYINWVDYSLEFEKNMFDRNFEIDLHWDLSYMRKNIPNFKESWNRRITLNIGGNNIQTLSKLDNFIHLCAHSAKDGWMIKRDLIEIFLLSRKIPEEKIKKFENIKFIRNSIYASNFIVNAEDKLIIDHKKRGKVIEIAYKNQLLPKRYLNNIENNFLVYFKNFYSLISLNLEFSDQLRAISHKILRPSLFSKHIEKHTILLIFFKRIKRFIERFL